MRDLERPGILRSRRMRRDHPRWTLARFEPRLGGGAGRCGVRLRSAGPRGRRTLGIRLRLGPFRRPAARFACSGIGTCSGSGRAASPDDGDASCGEAVCCADSSKHGRGPARGGLTGCTSARGSNSSSPGTCIFPGTCRTGATRPGLGRGPLRLLGPGLRRMQVPHPGGHQDFILLRERGHPAPGPRFGDVPELRTHQLRQPLAFNDRPRAQPGEHSGRKYVKPYQGVVKRQSDSNEENNIRNSNRGKDADPGDRQRCWQPKIV